MFVEIARQARGEAGSSRNIPGFYYTIGGDAFYYENYRFEAVGALQPRTPRTAGCGMMGQKGCCLSRTRVIQRDRAALLLRPFTRTGAFWPGDTERKS